MTRTSSSPTSKARLSCRFLYTLHNIAKKWPKSITRVRQQGRKGQYNPVILTGDLCLRSPHAKIISPPLRSVDYFLWGPWFSKKCIFFISDTNRGAKNYDRYRRLRRCRMLSDLIDDVEKKQATRNETGNTERNRLTGGGTEEEKRLSD